MPPLPEGYLERGRLHRRLDDALDDARVVTIVAPAACGKTTLLLGWRAAHAERPVAYLALDVLDNDPVWFWSRVVTAIRGFDTGIGSMAADHLATDGDRTRFVAMLHADLADVEPTVLVLDRLDQVTSPQVLDMLDRLLASLPGCLRVVVASRTEPPLRLGILRPRGVLAEVPASELAFDTDEVEVLLRRFGGDRYDRADAASLHERTRGWVGGVTLAVTAPADDHRDVVRGLTGTSRHVADLLRQEVLDHQVPEVKDFLLKSSVLDILDPNAAAAATGCRASASLLESMERSGLFLERIGGLTDGRDRTGAEVGGAGPPADGGIGHQVRYQRLFQEFLRHELHLVDPEGERAAHRAAALWFEQRDDINRSIGHLLAAGDDGAAIRLVLDHGERYAATGRLQLVRDWLTALPTSTLVGDLGLMLNIGRLCLIAGLRDDAALWLERMRWRLGSSHAPLLDALLAMLQGHARMEVGDPEAAIEECERAMAILEPLDEPTPWVVDWAHHTLAAAHMTLDHFQAARRHRDATSFNEQHAVLRASYSALLNHREGHLDRALQHAEVARRATGPWLWSLPLAARGAVERERNQTPEAEADLLAAIELGERWSRPFSVCVSAMELAAIRAAQGRPAQAHELLTRARSAVEGPALRRRVDVAEATLWLAVGDPDRSIRIRHGLPPGRDTAALDVRLALARDRLDDALHRVRALAASAGSLRERIVALMLEARALAPVDGPAAQACLQRAVDLGRQERFVRIYALDLPEVHHLMHRLATEQDDPYVFGLLAAVADAPGPTRRSAVLVDALSTRESIVLRYLPTSLSNKQIAAELHMSVNTLKTHLKSINRKLGTRSRAEAIAAARSLSLI